MLMFHCRIKISLRGCGAIKILEIISLRRIIGLQQQMVFVLFSAMIKKNLLQISLKKKVSPKFVTSVIFFKSNKSLPMLLFKSFIATAVKLSKLTFSYAELSQCPSQCLFLLKRCLDDVQCRDGSRASYLQH